MSIALTHPTGNANVRAAAVGLAMSGALHQFHTAIAVFPGTPLDRISRQLRPLKELQRRRFDKSLAHCTTTWPWHEIGRLVASKAGWSTLLTHETGRFSIDQVYQQFDHHIANWINSQTDPTLTGIYAYEDGALETFQAAKKRGLVCLYDLPIGYWRAARRLLGTEQIQRPDWANTLTGFRDSTEKLARKDKELSLADHILVASTFTAQTLSEYPGSLAPVSVIPYGFPTVNTKSNRTIPQGRRLRMLFVGGLSQRKGIANLFEAVMGLDNWIELTVVGQKTGVNCPALDYALSQHRWIPSLSHDRILALMQTQDILVFPSLFEGFGLVITEAMSQGTPVITTERTAGPDLIMDGNNGWIIEAGSTQALRQMLDALLQNPRTIIAAGKAARETARLRPWEIYGKELAGHVAEISTPA